MLPHCLQRSAAMGRFRNLVKGISSSPWIPSTDDLSREKGRFTQRLSFFRRRIRLKGNSSISIPLGVVLLFPCIVVALVVILFIRHPSSPGRILLPAGSPPSIRSVIAKLTLWSCFSSHVYSIQKDKRRLRQSICYRLFRAAESTSAAKCSIRSIGKK